MKPPGVNFRELLRCRFPELLFFVLNEPKNCEQNEQSQAAPLIALRPLIQEPYPPRLWKKHLQNLGILNNFKVTEKTSPTPSVN